MKLSTVAAIALLCAPPIYAAAPAFLVDFEKNWDYANGAVDGYYSGGSAADGSTDFAFRNEHAATTPGPFSADKSVSPAPQAGDLVLFPSYPMQAVPPKPGEQRITMAFNAIPTRLDSWGYQSSFAG